MLNKLAVIGATGNLGTAVCEALKQDARFVLEGAYTHSLSTKLAPPFRSDLENSQARVWLEVSLASSLTRTLPLALEKKMPLVIGSTGLSEEQRQAIETAAQFIPILYTPNFSIGMSLLSQFAKQLASLINADISIVETHRKTKQDTPSGSALQLAAQIAAHGAPLPPIHSIRSKDVFGEHEIRIELEGEQLILSHHVRSRLAFAKGALDACAFLLSQSPGLYSMEDMIYTLNQNAQHSSRESSNREGSAASDALRPLRH